MALAGHMVDQTEKNLKLPVCSVERWAEVLMKKVSEAAAVGDVFAAKAVRTAQAENQRLLSGLQLEQLSQMEARLTQSDSESDCPASAHWQQPQT